MAKRTEHSGGDAPATRKVRLTRPGVLACGPYEAGEVYEVEAAEAARLVDVKGFQYVDVEG